MIILICLKNWYVIFIVLNPPTKRLPCLDAVCSPYRLQNYSHAEEAFCIIIMQYAIKTVIQVWDSIQDLWLNKHYIVCFT